LTGFALAGAVAAGAAAAAGTAAGTAAGADDLHESLCDAQASVWHAELQYRAPRQREHSWLAPSLPQLSKQHDMEQERKLFKAAQ
jgi:hypothetical protein